MMSEKILSRPKIEQDIFTKPAGIIAYNALCKYAGDSVALVNLGCDESYTYKQIKEYSQNLTVALRKLGITKNDTIGIISNSTHKYFVAVFAGLFIAAPVHLINPNYTEYELKHILKLSKPKLVFCDQSSVEKLISLQKDFSWMENLILFDKYKDLLRYDDLIQTPSQDFEIETNIDINKHVAVVLNSSGTTGLPKGVMISHTNFLADYILTMDSEMVLVLSDEVSLIVAPLYHMYGFSITKSSLYLGAKTLIMPQFQPKLYLEAIEKYKVTSLYTVPSLAAFLASSPMIDNYDLTSVSQIYIAGSAPNNDVLEILPQRFPIKHVRQLYSLTELVAGVCVTPFNETKTGSCGKLFAGRKLKIVDQKTGAVLGPNQNGEIFVGGDVMLGYINNFEETKRIIDNDGFMSTGDYGYYDEDGFVFIVERLKDLIKYKSFQVAPQELEAVIGEIEGVVDVAVIGKPDERVGEVPFAFVVKKDNAQITEQQIIEYVAKMLNKDKHLYGGVKFVTNIPRNNLGKILRKNLRELI